MADVPADADDRNQSRGCVRTISSCEQELADIQNLLENLSTDITKKIDEKSATLPIPKRTKKKTPGPEPLYEVLTCSNVEFEFKTNRMSLMDLDLTQMTLHAELKMLQSYLTQTDGLDENEISTLHKKISVVQDRMYRCITKKGQALSQQEKVEFEKRHSRQFIDDNETCAAPPKPERFVTRESVVTAEIEDLTVGQLEVLLRHNSIDIPENSSRDSLLELVAKKLLPEVWDPPDVDSIHWNNVDDLERYESDISTSYGSPTSPASPINQNYFSLNPSGFQDYMKYKLLNDTKLIEWDPTDLLKELYGKITAGARKLEKAPSVKNKKVHCMQGYLDKLPMNKLKARPFKGWRKRFFQVARGKLFYYEDHKAETPFGHIDILGSEVEAGENNTIIVTARLLFGENKTVQGNRLILRCNSDSELKDWLAALKTMSSIEPVPGTFVRDGSLKKKKENKDIIIIDLGSSAIRAGLTTDASPVVAFPSAFAVKKQESVRRFTVSGLPDPHSCRCGFEAFFPENRKDAKLVYPLKPTLKVDKYSVKVRYLPGILEKVFHTLGIDATNQVVIVSCPRYLSDKDKEFILDYMFSQMSIQAVYMQQQAVLALYSYGVTTGLIVDIGDHLDVLPLVDGVVVEKGAMSLPYAGQQVTEYLGKLLTENGYRFFSDIESYVVRHVKEQVAEASMDFQEDMTSSPKLVDVDIEPYHLPDDKKNIRVGNMKYRCVEGLFNPGLWGKDDPALHEIVEHSIKACDIDKRKEMSRNIYLSGGSSYIKGLDTRLEEELKSCLSDASSIQVIASENRLNAAFKGAVKIAGLYNFKDLLITRAEWNEHGKEILSKWKVS